MPRPLRGAHPRHARVADLLPFDDLRGAVWVLAALSDAWRWWRSRLNVLCVIVDAA